MGFSINNPGGGSSGPAAATRFDLSYPGSSGTGITPTANVVKVAGLFALPYVCTFTNLQFTIVSADTNAAHLYDLGIYDLAGNLLANLGAQAFTTAGSKDLAVAQGTVTLNPGMYTLCATGNAAVAGFWVRVTIGDTILATLNPTSATASASGALPSTITYSGLTTWAVGSGSIAGNFSLHS